jgi:hypothetical protein
VTRGAPSHKRSAFQTNRTSHLKGHGALWGSRGVDDRVGPIGRTERSDGRYGSHPFYLLEEGFVVVVPVLWACAWAYLSSCSRILARSTESGQVFMHLCVPLRLNLGLARDRMGPIS